MKYLWLMIPVFITGCSSIKSVAVYQNRLVTQDNRPVAIVGNPPVVCHYANSAKTYSGYFEYQDSDGTIVVDNFGHSITYLRGNPICELRLDTNGYASIKEK